MKKHLSNKGFTLIELVVVIVILGILMLLIIPRINEFQQNAEVRTCQGNQRTLGSAQAMYYSENDNTTTADVDDLEPFVGVFKCPVSGDTSTYELVDPDDPYVWTCTESSGSKTHTREES